MGPLPPVDRPLMFSPLLRDLDKSGELMVSNKDSKNLTLRDTTTSTFSSPAFNPPVLPPSSPELDLSPSSPLLTPPSRLTKRTSDLSMLTLQDPHREGTSCLLGCRN